MAHGSMMIGCEHETNAGFANAVFYCRGTDIETHAQMLQHLRGARFRRQGAVAVFGYMYATRRNDQRRGGGNIVGAGAVAARAAGIKRMVGRFDGKGMAAHDLCAGSDLFNCFTAHAQCH